MTMERIRRQYNVPAKRGMRVIVDGMAGTITGTRRDAAHLLVRFDGTEHSVFVHPTWRVEYLETPSVDALLAAAAAPTPPLAETKAWQTIAAHAADELYPTEGLQFAYVEGWLAATRILRPAKASSDSQETK